MVPWTKKRNETKLGQWLIMHQIICKAMSMKRLGPEDDSWMPPVVTKPINQ